MTRRQLEDRDERPVRIRRGARQPRDPMSERKNAILIALLEQLIRSEQEHHHGRPGQRTPREFVILWDRERQRSDGREFKAVRDVYQQDYGKWRVTSSYNIDGRGTPGWRFTHRP
jgi:hypothetical protein